METPNGTIDLGLKNTVKRVEPTEKKDFQDYELDDFVQLFNQTEWRNNGVVDLEID